MEVLYLCSFVRAFHFAPLDQYSFLETDNYEPFIQFGNENLRECDSQYMSVRCYCQQCGDYINKIHEYSVDFHGLGCLCVYPKRCEVEKGVAEASRVILNEVYEATHC